MRSGEFKIESVFIRVKLKGMLSLPSNCQQGATPIRRHHRNCRTAFHSFYVAAQAIIPVETAIAVTNDYVAVVHDLKRSRLMIQFELMQVPCESDLVLIDGVVLANREEGIAHRMEQASSYCRVVVQVNLLNNLLGMRVPEFY